MLKLIAYLLRLRGLYIVQIKTIDGDDKLMSKAGGWHNLGKNGIKRYAK